MDSSKAHGSDVISSPGAAHKPGPAPKRGSPLRLGILLLILAICIVALVYDFQFAKPASEAATKKLESYVETRNQMSVKEAGPITRADIQKEMGRSPTWVEEEPTYTVEWYCWWGKIPLLSDRRHYITVLYVGDDRRFSTQTLNGPPAEDDLPTHFMVERSSDLGPLGTPGTMPPASGTGAERGPPGMPPMGMPPGMGGKGKGKKGKGGGVGSTTAPIPGGPSSESPATKSDQPTESNDKPSADKPAESSDKPSTDKPSTDKPAEPSDKPAEPDKPADPN